MSPLRKIIITYLATGALAVVLVAAFLTRQEEDLALERWESMEAVLAASLGHRLQRFLDAAVFDLQLAARLAEVGELAARDQADPAFHGVPLGADPLVRDVLDDLWAGGERFSVLFVLQSNGDHYMTHPYRVQESLRRFNLAERPYFQEARRTRKPAVSDSFIGSDGVPAVAVDVPVLDDEGRIVAHLGGVLHLTDLSEMVDRRFLRDVSFGFIVDRSDHLIGHTDRTLLDGDDHEAFSAHPILRKSATPDEPAVGTYMDPLDGRDYLTAFVRLPQGWGVGVSRSREAILVEVRPQVRQAVLVVGLLLLGIGGIGVLGVRWIGRRWEAAEARLRDSEQVYRRLFSGNKAVELLIDPETGVIRDANQAAEAFYGWSAETLKTMGIQDINTLTPDEVAAEMQRAREEDRNHFFFRHRLADGQVRDVEVHSGPVEMEDRTLLYSIVHDVTDRKQAEERLRASEEKFRQLVESTNVVAWELDLDSFTFTYVSPHAEALLGYPLADWKQPGFWESHIHPDDRDETVRFCLTETGQGRDHDFEYRMIKADGSAVWLRDIVTVQKDADGTVVGLQGFMVDIDKRKRIEETLKSSNAELEQFAYVASHDLQEPLRMVVSYLQLLERRYGEDLEGDARDYIGFAVDGARRMSRLIKDLLDYSRIGTRGAPPRPTDAGEAVQAALDNLAMAASESGARVDWRDLPTVMADTSQLTSLFQNLIGNAIKYRAADRTPEIRVTAEEGESEWLFSVSDNGIGIDPAFHDKVFMVFQRLHGRDAFEGTGIGLAMCKKIVDRHGGRIWVESAEGEGSAFRFTLPKNPGLV